LRGQGPSRSSLILAKYGVLLGVPILGLAAVALVRFVADRIPRATATAQEHNEILVAHFGGRPDRDVAQEIVAILNGVGGLTTRMIDVDDDRLLDARVAVDADLAQPRRSVTARSAALHVLVAPVERHDVVQLRFIPNQSAGGIWGPLGQLEYRLTLPVSRAAASAEFVRALAIASRLPRTTAEADTLADSLIGTVARLDSLRSSEGRDPTAEYAYALAAARLADLTLDVGFLDSAVAALRRAIDVSDRKATASTFGLLYHNLGTILMALGERARDVTVIHQALAAYDSALAVRTRDAAPFDWAATQQNVGRALWRWRSDRRKAGSPIVPWRFWPRR
jgi:hypothetical protein